MKNIILIGKPGSGKGTQGELISSNKNYISVITGDILRKTSKSNTDLGKLVKSTIDSGNLVSDEMINSIISEFLQTTVLKYDESLLFDGYPRTIDQAKFLDTLTSIDKVIFLNVDEEETVKRILYRGKTSNREDDKNESIIRTRLENYNKVTLPIIEYYKKQNKLHTIDGNKSTEDVYSEILSIINF